MAFRVRALQKGELDGFLLCFQDAFGIDDASISVVRNSLVNDPCFHPERVRVGLLNDRIVSHVVILHRAAYVASQTVMIAGVTAVATHPSCQGQGYGTRVMEDALRVIKRQGYHLAMLTTRVPGFFLRLGFREAPKANGYACPSSALSRLPTDDRYDIQSLDYHRDWRVIHQVYRSYSPGLTGLQVREARFWETWPRRGTFPHGFSSRLGAVGLLATREGHVAAYLAGSVLADQAHLAVSDLAHLRGHEGAALRLLQHAGQRSLDEGLRQAVVQVGGNAPVIPRLRAAGVPLEVEVGPGLMLLFPSREWLASAGFRNQDEAIERLFRSDPPILWHRDGY